MALIEKIPITSREQWLDLRKADVTASVEPALHGLHPYISPLRLYIEKQGLVELPELKDVGAIRRGRLLESAVAEAVKEQRPHWQIRKAEHYWRDRDLRLGCTPDFYISDTEFDRNRKGVLQAKTAARSVFERDWHDGKDCRPPLWIVLQVQIEMMLTASDFGAIGLLVASDYDDWPCHIFEVPRHGPAEIKIRQAVRQFWLDIAAGKEPDADYGKDRDLIAALAPRELAQKTVDLSTDNEVVAGLAEREEIKQRIKADSERCREIEAMVMSRMRDAERAIVPNFNVTWKTEPRKGYQVEPSEPRVLRIREQR